MMVLDAEFSLWSRSLKIKFSVFVEFYILVSLLCQIFFLYSLGCFCANIFGIGVTFSALNIFSFLVLR